MKIGPRKTIFRPLSPAVYRTDPKGSPNAQTRSPFTRVVGHNKENVAAPLWVTPFPRPLSWGIPGLALLCVEPGSRPCLTFHLGPPPSNNYLSLAVRLLLTCSRDESARATAQPLMIPTVGLVTAVTTAHRRSPHPQEQEAPPTLPGREGGKEGE